MLIWRKFCTRNDLHFEIRLAFDAFNNAIAVWDQNDETRSNIWSSRYIAGVGWGIPSLIENQDTSNFSNPNIAIDSGGNATATWYQYGDSKIKIWMNRYILGSGWQTEALLIETNYSIDGYQPEISFDDAGNAIAVWNELDSSFSQLWAKYFRSGFGWEAAIMLQPNNNMSKPKIVFDNSGNAIATWSQQSATELRIYSNLYK